MNNDDDLLKQAADLIRDKRQQDYGHPAVNFERIAQGWSVIFDDGCFDAERVALAMVWTKICRQLNKHKNDNLVDAIGYILTIDQIRTQQQKISDILADIDIIETRTWTIPKNRDWKDNV